MKYSGSAASTASPEMRFDEPELLIRAAGNLGEDIDRVPVAKLIALVNRVANALVEGR